MTTLDLSEYDDEGIYELRDGRIAVSPYPDYPGEITFPKKFKGKLFKQYVKSVEEQANNEELEGLWATVWLFATHTVEGLDADYDENDMHLNRWCVAMLMRYVNPYLVEKLWQRPSGAGADTTGLPPG